MGKCQKVHIIIVIGSLVVFYFGFIEVEQARNEKIVLEKTVKQQYDPLLSNAQILENSLRKLFILTYLDVQTEEQIIADNHLV